MSNIFISLAARLRAREMRLANVLTGMLEEGKLTLEGEPFDQWTCILFFFLYNLLAFNNFSVNNSLCEERGKNDEE